MPTGPAPAAPSIARGCRTRASARTGSRRSRSSSSTCRRTRRTCRSPSTRASPMPGRGRRTTRGSRNGRPTAARSGRFVFVRIGMRMIALLPDREVDLGRVEAADDIVVSRQPGPAGFVYAVEVKRGEGAADALRIPSHRARETRICASDSPSPARDSSGAVRLGYRKMRRPASAAMQTPICTWRG